MDSIKCQDCNNVFCGVVDKEDTCPVCMERTLKNNFLDDKDKMIDFHLLTKDQFLQSYSYITPEEYENTQEEYAKINIPF